MKILACSNCTFTSSNPTFTCLYYFWSRFFHHLTLLSVNRFANKLVPSVPNNISRNPSFCFFTLFYFVSLTPFINKTNSSRNLIIFIISSIISFESINVVIPDPKKFLLNSCICF